MFKEFLTAPLSIPAGGSSTFVAPMPDHVTETVVNVASISDLTITVDWYNANGEDQVAQDTIHDAVVPSFASGAIKSKSPYAIIVITNKDGAAAASVDQVSLFY